MKGIVFVGKALENIRSFPEGTRKDVGYQLHRLQNGLEPLNWKPMKSIGAGVKEIRIIDENGNFRIIYVTKLKNKIYVLHSFKKKTQKTAQKDIEIALKALKQIEK